LLEELNHFLGAPAFCWLAAAGLSWPHPRAHSLFFVLVVEVEVRDGRQRGSLPLRKKGAQLNYRLVSQQKRSKGGTAIGLLKRFPFRPLLGSVPQFSPTNPRRTTRMPLSNRTQPSVSKDNALAVFFLPLMIPVASLIAQVERTTQHEKRLSPPTGLEDASPTHRPTPWGHLRGKSYCRQRKSMVSPAAI
jgi:hypothetical protein